MSDTKFPFNVGDEVYIAISRGIIKSFEAVYQVIVTDRLIEYFKRPMVYHDVEAPYEYFGVGNLKCRITKKYIEDLNVPNVSWGLCDITVISKVSYRYKIIEGNINPYKLMAKNNLIPIDQSNCNAICAYSNKFNVTIVRNPTVRNPTYFDREAVYHDFEKPIDNELYQVCFGDKIAKLSVDNNKI